MGPEGYDPSATNLKQPDTPVEMKVFQGGGLSEGQIGGGPQESLLPQPETPMEMKVFQGGGKVQSGGSKEWMTAFDGGYTLFTNTQYFRDVKNKETSTATQKKAAALYILAKDTGRVMLYKRAQEQTIGGPGGQVDPGEPVWLTALREASEEVGFLPTFHIQSSEWWKWFSSRVNQQGNIDVATPSKIPVPSFITKVNFPQLIQAATLLNSIKDRLIPIYATNNIVVYLFIVENELEQVKAQVGEVDTSYDWSDFKKIGKDIGDVREGIAYVGFPDILQHIKANYSSLSKTSEQKQLIVLKCLMILNGIREASDANSLSKQLLTIATTQSLSELLQSIPGPQQQSPQQPQQPQQPPQTPTVPTDLVPKLSGLMFRGVKFTDLVKDPAFASFQPIIIPTPAFTESWLTAPIDVELDGVKTVVAPLSAGPSGLYLFHPLGGECTPDRLQTAWGDASQPFIVLFGTPLLKPSTSIFSSTGQAASSGTPSGSGKASQQSYVIDNKTPKVTLSNGITVRYMEIGDPLKQDIMDLKFTADEEYLFTKVLKFRKPWILQWIQQPGHAEEFYAFWKVYVNRDGTSELTLVTSREKNMISQFLRKLLKEYQKALHTATWDWLKTKYPDNFEDFAEDYDAGFFFTTPKAAGGTPTTPPATTPSGSPPAADPLGGSSPGGSPPGGSPGTSSTGTTAQGLPQRKAAIAALAKLKQIVRENIGDTTEESATPEPGDEDYDPNAESNSESNDGEPAAPKKKKELTPEEEDTLFKSTLVDLVNRVLDKDELDSIGKVDAILSIFVPNDSQLKSHIKLFLHTFVPTEAGGPINAAQWKPSKTSYYGSDVGTILNDLISLDPATVEDPQKLTEFRKIFDKITPAGKRAQAAYARKQAQLRGTQPPRGRKPAAPKPTQPPQEPAPAPGTAQPPQEPQATPAVPAAAPGTAQPPQQPQATPGVPAAAPGTAQPPQQPQATPAVPAAAPGTAQPPQQPQATPAVPAAAPGQPQAEPTPSPVPAKKARGRQQRAAAAPPGTTGAAFSPGLAPAAGVTTRTKAAQQGPAAAPATGETPDEPVGGKRKRTQGGGGSGKGRKTRRKSHTKKSIASSGSSRVRTSRKARSR